MTTLRVHFSKTGAASYLSHLDTLRTFYRALRRSGLPLELSHGFNVRPRISIAAALPVGMVGEDEYLDTDLANPHPVAAATRVLAASLPTGLRILEAAVLGQTKALEPLVAAAEYRMELAHGHWDLVGLRREVDLLLAQEHLPFPRTKGLVDLRPGIISLDAAEEAGVLQLKLCLTAGSRGTVRPEEVLKLLAEGAAHGHMRPAAVCRCRLLTAIDTGWVPLREVAFAKGVEVYAHGDHDERGAFRDEGRITGGRTAS